MSMEIEGNRKEVSVQSNSVVMMMSGLSASGWLPSRGPGRKILETITRQFFERARAARCRQACQGCPQLGCRTSASAADVRARPVARLRCGRPPRARVFEAVLDHRQQVSRSVRGETRQAFEGWAGGRRCGSWRNRRRRPSPRTRPRCRRRHRAWSPAS
jgi:hypothetical protein